MELMEKQFAIADFIKCLEEYVIENDKLIVDLEKLDELDEFTIQSLFTAFERQVKYLKKIVLYQRQLFDIQKKLMEI